MAQRRFYRGVFNGLLQNALQFAEERKTGTDLHEEHNLAGVLTGWAVQVDSFLHVVKHGVVDDFPHRRGFAFTQLF